MFDSYTSDIYSELEPDNWLDDAILDLTITRLKYNVHTSEFQWKKWIRTV